MSFSRADRFGKGSYLEHTQKKGITSEFIIGNTNENCSPNVRRTIPSTKITPNFRGKVHFKTAATPRDESNLPAYMRSTASSSKKAASLDVNGVNGEGERLKFSKPEGNDFVAPVPKFGSNVKGGTSGMRREKHGRFSMATSYLVQSKGENTHSIGVGHNSLANGKGVTSMGKNKTDRFGKGSYLEHTNKKDIKSEFLLGHSDLGQSNIDPNKTSAAFKPSKLDKSDWLRTSTVLADKDMQECKGRDDFGQMSSEFTVDYRAHESAIFKDRSDRFEKVKLDPGREDLASLPQFGSDAKGGSSSMRKGKHSRFSEFGGMYQTLQKPALKLSDQIIEEGEDE
mmetsp:Transcript_17407/g.19731  ORF Transcript_17407/g.19731 Transcript_17407/m.19731 type:complete len:340 (-) Transcript_17407:438-1457(-)|eukprot:CAMPEP_0204823562 /NCGR_PEP_ID=MMETSP1346-20131115/1625_1 /ASSEMBLY_ACC=CAM_ASM_000771 /TAXON_ID=215587 /ORGANISM="Aplanochytrium stocchinoi, Strain GSBS06" /LENGTH=339 /DNA_ID=CAMNT_0051950245 /DNA_START=130 /DNA_END=1149 /DNA_ORIENTATION=-